jgi:hypothetical protein
MSTFSLNRNQKKKFEIKYKNTCVALLLTILYPISITYCNIFFQSHKCQSFKIFVFKFIIFFDQKKVKILNKIWNNERSVSGKFNEEHRRTQMLATYFI